MNTAVVHGTVLILRGTVDSEPEALVAALDSVARAYLDGIRLVLCLACEGQDLVRSVNRLLTVRGLEPMRFKYIPPTDRRAAKLVDICEDHDRVARRRGIFMTAAASSPTALAQIQAVEGALFAVSPEIDPARCTGCDACTRICPSDVLTQIKMPSGDLAYHIDAGTCDACGLCQAVCDPEAIALRTMIDTPSDIQLRSWVCKDCGVGVHQPASQPDIGDGLCPPCRQAGHHKKLFQVLP